MKVFMFLYRIQHSKHKKPLGTHGAQSPLKQVRLGAIQVRAIKINGFSEFYIS